MIGITIPDGVQQHIVPCLVSQRGCRLCEQQVLTTMARLLPKFRSTEGARVLFVVQGTRTNELARYFLSLRIPLSSVAVDSSGHFFGQLQLPWTPAVVILDGDSGTVERVLLAPREEGVLVRAVASFVEGFLYRQSQQGGDQ